MILSETAISVIKGSAELKEKFAFDFNVNNSTVWNWWSKNKPNNPLTTIQALRIFEDVTGLTEDQLYVDEKITETLKA